MKRISNIFRTAVIISAALASCSCRESARISGNLKDAPGKEITVKVLDINRYETLDTLKTKSDGSFTYNINIKKGQPEFVYLFSGDTRIASLLLQSGDRVNVQADTLGHFTVSGSEETSKLIDVEQAYASFTTKSDGLAARLADVPEGSGQATDIKEQLARHYVSYYRDRMKYIISNPYSMSVIPVFYQKFGEMPVFASQTDAILFGSICDSLETVYPDSKYVKALRVEAGRRQTELKMSTMISSAQEVGYPDIKLPDMSGNEVKLSESEGKVTMVMFWLASDAEQKMFNLDFVKKIWDEYNEKGLRIYQVSLDADKMEWAQVMRNQKLPWINVCDTRSAESPYMTLYNLREIPSIFLISNGEFIPDEVRSEAQLRSVLKKYLK